VIAADRLPARGNRPQGPGRLGALLDGGVIDEMVVGTGDVLIALRLATAGASWATTSGRHSATRCWIRRPAGRPRTRRHRPAGCVAAELLAGPIGALAESHGGSIRIGFGDRPQRERPVVGRVHGCPAAAPLLHDKLQRELSRRSGSECHGLQRKCFTRNAIGQEAAVCDTSA